MNRKFFSVLFLVAFVSKTQLQAKVLKNSLPDKLPEGRVESPYEACKDAIIVDKDKYMNMRETWEFISQECQVPILTTASAGFTDLDPLKEAADYMDLATKVAQKVEQTLQENITFAGCAFECFAHNNFQCSNAKFFQKYTNCDQFKNSVKKKLSDEGKGLKENLIMDSLLQIKDVNAKTVRKITKNLKPFNSSLPNPLGTFIPSPEEMKIALEKRKESKNRLKSIEENRKTYLEKIYAEYPIFAVIGPAHKFTDDGPEWTDTQIAEAFVKNETNAKKTLRIVKESLKKSKLEFDRINGEAIMKWLGNIAPSEDTKSADLLYFMAMKNKVEEVLKTNPEYCGYATTINNRISSKGLQNMGGIIPGFMLGSIVTGGALASATGLTVGAASALTSFGLISPLFWSEAYQDLKTVQREIATSSGFADAGKNIRSNEELQERETGLKLTALLFPLDLIGVPSATKALMAQAKHQMIKNTPGMNNLLKKTKLTPKEEEELVGNFLWKKINDAVNSGLLSKDDALKLKDKNTLNFFDKLATQVHATNPKFFSDADNISLLLELVAKNSGPESRAAAEKAAGLISRLDPTSLPIDKKWDVEASNGFAKFALALTEELKQLSPDKLAKVGTYDLNANDIEMAAGIAALRKAGVKEADIEPMLVCANKNWVK